eukprot:CAMPEP_0180223930 /NCGR_PEP_ID=MMETSP0987-20121128/21744_1 /TAXON_ID=697907 /ORGANISM="non described non described, Strain CCMP2293" /LENGTH=67 /DNA_ID=CAMNT_0022186593 /DNA_START=167 /DNA_END=370 /DNA_ORIENTATION=+
MPAGQPTHVAPPAGATNKYVPGAHATHAPPWTVKPAAQRQSAAAALPAPELELEGQGMHELAPTVGE